MNTTSRVMGAIFCFIFGLIMLGTTLPGALDSTVAENVDENFGVETGVGETSAICTLTDDHYYEDTTHMSVTSSGTATDTAAIMSYTVATKEVTVGGLEQSAYRILNIDYYRERDNDGFSYFSAFVTITPFILGIGLIWKLIKDLITG